MRLLSVVLVSLVACGSDPAVGTLRVERATPDYGPLGGGTVIALHGAGFGAGDRVLIGGREAPLVRALDDTQLELVIPPGEQPGDVEVVVFGDTGSITARGIFRYSTPPSITAVSPADVVGSSSDTLVTVTGTGFTDEGAGELYVLVDGQPVAEPVVTSDTTMTFVAPPGRVFGRPDLEIVNVRGRTVAPNAFRYTPGPRPGLLLFPRWGGSFAVFYDPVANTTVPIPPRSPSPPRFTSVVRDADGQYWAVDVSNRIGRLDLDTQTLVAPILLNTRIPALARAGDDIVGLARYWGNGGRFGTVDVASGTFAPVGTTPLFCCGSYGIASDGSTVWFTARQDWTTVYINTVDRTTGAVGTPVTLAGGNGFRVEELRAWNGTLYATVATGKLVTIDPETGAVTELLTGFERYTALEPFE